MTPPRCRNHGRSVPFDGSLGVPERYGPVLGLDIPAMPDQRPLPVEWRSRLGLTDGCGFDVDGNLWVTLVMANKVVASWTSVTVDSK